MIRMYAMQRANGDWFAFDNHGHLCVPVFRSIAEAKLARLRNLGMMLFQPVALDEHALENIAPAHEEFAASFWLVDNPSANLRYGYPLEHEQLTGLIYNGLR